MKSEFTFDRDGKPVTTPKQPPEDPKEKKDLTMDEMNKISGGEKPPADQTRL